MFPVEMIERVIKMSSSPGDLILDPFVGSGTTLIAAKNLGRKGVGIELDERYEEIIKKRIANESKDSAIE